MVAVAECYSLTGHMSDACFSPAKASEVIYGDLNGNFHFVSIGLTPNPKGRELGPPGINLWNSQFK